MKKKNQIKRSVAVFIAMAMCLSFNNIVFAAETSDTNEQVVVVEPSLGENGATIEEALEILGITEEEAEGSTIYVYDVPLTATAKGQMIISPDDYAQLVGEFSFSGQNVGSTLIAFKNAKTMQYGVRWRWLNPDTRTCAVFRVRLTNNMQFFDAGGMSDFGDSSYHYCYSDKCEVSSSYSYHFVYDCYWGYYAGEDFEFPRVEARVAIQAFND